MEEVRLDLLQHGLESRLGLTLSHSQLFTGVSPDGYKLTALHVSGPNFEADWDSLCDRRGGQGDSRLCLP